jgi:uncharacterized protein YndB with AHSA1/START domain
MPKPVVVKTPTDREVVVVRTFDAPVALVWDAHTKPELLQRWLVGQPGWTMPYCRVDLRVGGKYRYVWRNTESGREFGSHGEHLEVETHARIVTSERMDGLDGNPIDYDHPAETGDPAINTLVMAESAGRTTITLSMVFPSKEVRDMAVGSGMTDGMAMGYDLLDALLEAVG